jgi:hypothetical protein
LRKAASAGVEILPYAAKVTPKGILLAEKIATRLEIPSLPLAQRT